MAEWAEKSGKKSPAFGKPDEKIRIFQKKCIDAEEKMW